jgi:hypothetical protein
MAVVFLVVYLRFRSSIGGLSLGPNPTQIPDWVDASVAGWIKHEAAAMEAAWDSIETRVRGALAFVHIPP